VSSPPCETGAGDDEASEQSPVGAARAEIDDDDDDDMANDARRSEELDGNLMKNNSSSGDAGRGVGFEPIWCELL
jgi:hypothetical protein